MKQVYRSPNPSTTFLGRTNHSASRVISIFLFCYVSSYMAYIACKHLPLIFHTSTFFIPLTLLFMTKLIAERVFSLDFLLISVGKIRLPTSHL